MYWTNDASGMVTVPVVLWPVCAALQRLRGRRLVHHVERPVGGSTFGPLGSLSPGLPADGGIVLNGRQVVGSV